jgi:hypothetical protein
MEASREAGVVTPQQSKRNHSANTSVLEKRLYESCSCNTIRVRAQYLCIYDADIQAPKWFG